MSGMPSWEYALFDPFNWDGVASKNAIGKTSLRFRSRSFFMATISTSDTDNRLRQLASAKYILWTHLQEERKRLFGDWAPA